MTLKSDAKFQENLTWGLKNDMRSLENFRRLKNSDFILESKMAELNQNKSLKQLDRCSVKARCSVKTLSYLRNK